jgi:hypothetical protein
MTAYSPLHEFPTDEDNQMPLDQMPLITAASSNTPVVVNREVAVFPVRLPNDAVPGQQLRLMVPAGFPTAGTFVDIVMPQGCTGGQVIQVTPPSPEFPVVLSPEAKPGQLFQAIVPVGTIGAGKKVGV